MSAQYAGRLTDSTYESLTVYSGSPTGLDRMRKFDVAMSHRSSARRPFAVHTLMQDLAVVGTPVVFSRDDEIYGVGEPTTYIYKVLGGAVRTCNLLSNGRRQIAGFYLPGDIFGLELCPEQYLSAEAVGDSTVLVFRRGAVMELAERSNDAAQELWILTTRQLQQVQNHALLLAKNALERVAAFLLEMATRMPAGNAINLPMSRQDIADYLGLTIETVSRTLTQLENDAAIELPTSRRIVLRDRNSLNRLNS